MAKAQVKMPGGISVEIEGTPEEIRTLVQELKATQSERGLPQRLPKQVTLASLFQSLIDDGFFKEPKDLVAIRVELERRGYHYPNTTLSPAVLRHVRKRNLRRLKKDDRWFYTRS